MTSFSPPKKKKCAASRIKDDLFASVCACFVEQTIGKARCEILKRQLVKHGGEWNHSVMENTTHVFVKHQGTSKASVLKLLKVKEISEKASVLSVEWLSACLVEGTLLAQQNYQACLEDNAKTSSTVGKISDALELSKKTQETEVESVCPGLKRSTSDENHNKFITKQIELLEKQCSNEEDKWRCLGYQKAIASIKNFHKPLQTFEEVSSLTFVGTKLAEKIFEIVQTDHLACLDHVNPKLDVITLFSGVWGVGADTAEIWYAKGFRSLEDLREKAELNFQQKLGLELYEELSERIPREEVEEMQTQIRNSITYMQDSGIVMEVCGSFRRRHATCKSIKVLLSHVDGLSHVAVLPKLLVQLKDDGLITHDLVRVDCERQSRYMGLCKVHKTDSKHRRVDFIIAPHNEWPCALIHFTGSVNFNVHMQQIANKMIMSLSQHSLRKNISNSTNDAEDISTITIPVLNEEDVFEKLDLEYLNPTQRDW